MGGVVHSVTDAVGLTNYKGQQEALRASKEASSKSYNLTKEQIAFQKQQYNDWKAIYGDIQDNLGDYYQHLTATDWKNQNFTAIQQHYQSQVAQVHKLLAQRGLDTSGIEASLDINSALQAAQAKANIEANADNYVAQQKMQFLGLGLGQGTQMLNTIAGVANTGAGAQAGISSSNIGAMSNISAANISSTSNIVGSAIGAYAAMNASVPGAKK